MACAQEREELLDRRTPREGDELFITANDFLEPPEEEHFNAYGLGNSGHTRIVTRNPTRG